jgi:hypothetical protein
MQINRILDKFKKLPNKKPTDRYEGMKKVGFWYSEYEPELPMPFAYSDNLNEEQRKSVIEYLENGKISASYLGFSHCRICNKNDFEMGVSDLTDGEWVWPEGLSHYVKNHQVELPKEFIDKILNK